MQKVVQSLPNKVSVKKTLVVAAFKEFQNLSELLKSLELILPIDVSIIIADDTGIETEDRITKIVREALSEKRNWQISFENKKSGRGSAVLRGFRLANETFSEVEFFAECDADGSHRPADISRVLSAAPADFLIGSRYLPESRIDGWPKSRKIASKILNFIIPIALEIKSTDVTNGLRRYSKVATLIILKNPPLNTGFIFLSEQALLLSRNGISPKEVPIIFINRIHGESSVGISEIFDSLKGVLILYRSNKRNK
jgi:dolichol-phosphate mannosyltransferase